MSSKRRRISSNLVDLKAQIKKDVGDTAVVNADEITEKYMPLLKTENTPSDFRYKWFRRSAPDALRELGMKACGDGDYCFIENDETPMDKVMKVMELWKKRRDSGVEGFKKIMLLVCCRSDIGQYVLGEDGETYPSATEEEVMKIFREKIATGEINDTELIEIIKNYA